MHIFKDIPAALKYIDQGTERQLHSMDTLWKFCEKNNFFDNKEFKNYLMWVEHEMSRPASMTKVATSEIRKELKID